MSAKVNGPAVFAAFCVLSAGSAIAEPFELLSMDYRGDGVQIVQSADISNCEIVVEARHFPPGEEDPSYTETTTIALDRVALADTGGRAGMLIVDAVEDATFSIRRSPPGAGKRELQPWRLVLRSPDAERARSAIEASAETCGGPLNRAEDARALERLIEADISFTGGRGGEANRPVTLWFALSEDGVIEGAKKLVEPKFRRTYAEENHRAALSSALDAASAEGRFATFANYPAYRATLSDGFVGLRADGEPRRPTVITGPDAVAAEEAEDLIRLSYGEKRDIQHYLNNQGLDAGDLDGVFGLRTREAIAVWQKDGGADATGFLNRQQASRILDDPEANAPPPFRQQAQPARSVAVSTTPTPTQEEAAAAETQEAGGSGNLVSSFADRVGPALRQAGQELSDLLNGDSSGDR